MSLPPPPWLTHLAKQRAVPLLELRNEQERSDEQEQEGRDGYDDGHQGGGRHAWAKMSRQGPTRSAKGQVRLAMDRSVRGGSVKGRFVRGRNPTTSPQGCPPHTHSPPRSPDESPAGVVACVAEVST